MYKINRRGIGTVGKLCIIAFLLVIAIFPTSRDGFVKEWYTEEETVHKIELKKTLDCNVKIANNKKKSWSLTNLGENLLVIVDIASTEVLRLKIECDDGVEIDEKGKIFVYNETMKGPSLVISLYNPIEILGKKADVKGSIKIYHEYDKVRTVNRYRMVPGKVWKIWWMWLLLTD